LDRVGDEGVESASELSRYEAATRAATTTTARFDAALTEVPAKLDRAARAKRRYGQAARDAAQQTSRFGNNLTQSLGNVAFIIDDLQYLGEQGIRPLINNLAPLALSFGAAGAAVAVAGTA